MSTIRSWLKDMKELVAQTDIPLDVMDVLEGYIVVVRRPDGTIRELYQCKTRQHVRTFLEGLVLGLRGAPVVLGDELVEEEEVEHALRIEPDEPDDLDEEEEDEDEEGEEDPSGWWE